MFHSSLRIYYRFAVMMAVFLQMLSFGTLSAAPQAQIDQITVPLHVNTGNDQGYTIKEIGRAHV